MIRLGTPDNDLIVTTQENDIVWGLEGADIIASNTGNDQLYGNQGNDVLLGGRGADSIWGGQDDDLIVGNPDADYVNGNLGNDTVHGGQGDDCVRGGQGNDWVSGDRGNDILYGDLGDDTLVGGPGEDIFVLGSGEDVILDFTPGQDKIGLAPGVTFDSLQVSQRGEDSVVSDRTTGAIIGIFQGINATSLEASQFTNLLLNIPAPSPPPSVPDIPPSSPSPAPSLSILPPAAEVTPIETDPGNTLETASSISLASTTRTFSQSVGGSDVADYYKFSLGATNTFELSLTGLTALATVDVLDEEGNIVLNGQLANNTSVISGELPDGLYRLRITSDAPTNYLLNTRITPQIPGVTTTISNLPVDLDTDLSGPLIGLNNLTSDPRFNSVNGTNFSTVVLDTGIDKNHPAFGGRVVYEKNYADSDPDASDYDGHGTNVASIIASSDSQYPGVAPGANIINFKVFSDTENNDVWGAIQQGLQWVWKNVEKYNIASVNMSLGGGNYNQLIPNGPISDELQKLAEKNVLVISSSGNDFKINNSQPGVGYPAADPNSLSIGAVYDENVGPYEFPHFGGAVSNSTAPNQITPFSQRHPNLITVFAPGAFIAGASPMGTSFPSYGGTSQAAPHVAGMAVLAQQLAMQTLGRKLTPAEFEQMLKETGDPIFDGDDEDDNVTNTDTWYKRANMFALAEAIVQLPSSIPLQANPDTLSGFSTTVTGTSGNDSLPQQANASNTVPITIDTADILANDLPNNNLVVDSVSNPFGNSVDLAGNTISFIPNILNPGGFDYTARNATTNQTSNSAKVILNFDLNLDGLAGNDLLIGGVLGRDTIQGGDGNDTIFAGVDSNTGTTVGGSDTVAGGRDNDSIWGGNGDDYLDVDASLVNSIIPSSDDAVQGNDTINGGFGNDTIGRLGASVGATGVDYYDGREGNDSIQGGNQGSNAIGDTLIGGDGNDTIRGGTDDSGRDSIVGGNGNDSIAGGAEGSGGDTIDGGNGEDSIQGEAGNDSVLGGIGHDFIDGGNDNDTVLGGDQNDTLLGGAGNDSIVGGNDQDTIEGGVGSDTLSGFNGSSGGDGTDRFVYNLNSILDLSPTTVGNISNVPPAVSQSEADYILAFDVNQDQIEIGTTVVPNVDLDNTQDPPSPVSLIFGGLPVNIGSGVGSTVGATYITGTSDSLIYIERNGVAGFTNEDIALMTLVGVTPNSLSSANFLGTPIPQPTVTLELIDGVAAENNSSNVATFTVTRTGGNIATNLSVNYTLGGTAVNGTDYQSLSGSVTIPAGQTQAVITVTPIDDLLFDGATTVDVTLAASGAYVLGTPNTGQATIYDNETVYVDDAYTTANSTVEGGQAVVGINAFDQINNGIQAAGGDNAPPPATNANPGIVVVRAGNYPEIVSINRPIRLQGPNAGVAGNAARNPEANITGTPVGSIAFDALGPGTGLVEIDGFLIDPPDNITGINTLNAGNNTIITNNIIENVTNEQAIFNPVQTNPALNNTENLSISNNLIRNVTTTGGNSDKDGIFLVGVTNLAIQNNEIQDITGTTSRGIQVSGIVGGTISNNSITNTTEEAIQLANLTAGFTTQNVTISDNTITNANTSSNVNNGGIRLRDGAFGAAINVTNNNVSTSFNGLAIRAGTGSLANVTVTNNALVANAGSLAITNLSGNPLTATGNFSDLARTTALVAGDVNGVVTI
ncbi:S8 family serine peptidase [Roseofilum sp. BLCC_M154]|uniref:S8 family serine peptidase n=1 Tax=Roseofilum acuticapitatum BLCC-M154 TaxID=3022444 RepID=A0ABT7AQ99_9CYAN|nr:S8 family serine peptidase [Roseofilum acuticapitatum]MDJ1168757.1 S8 family serine peptidase [Roseofilum acuticapitatum BLCC-M154]